MAIEPKLIATPAMSEDAKQEKHYRDDEPKVFPLGPDWAKTPEEAADIRAADTTKTS